MPLSTRILQNHQKPLLLRLHPRERGMPERHLELDR